jgi:hypothetical protein
VSDTSQRYERECMRRAADCRQLAGQAHDRALEADFLASDVHGRALEIHLLAMARLWTEKAEQAGRMRVADIA